MRPRHSRTREAAKVELFPFLAVLLCTMGALILLLVLITRQVKESRADVAGVSPPEPVAQGDQDLLDVEIQVELLDLRSEQLATQRALTAEDLANKRLELSHVESHIRELRSQLDQMERAVAEFAQLASLKEDQREDVDQRVAQIRARLAQLERDLAEARRKKENQPEAFAIIPYDGPNQTRRRPIYIECRDGSVVLQPEGIVLGETDFRQPLGPSNPLASALRAISEHIVIHQNQSDPQRPYPLLIVRPNGIYAYYAARDALKSWETEFGYELVDQEWELAYPERDPVIAELLTRTVEEARLRHARLARLAPRLVTGERRRLSAEEEDLDAPIGSGDLDVANRLTADEYGNGQGGSGREGSHRAGGYPQGGGPDSGPRAGIPGAGMPGTGDRHAAGQGSRIMDGPLLAAPGDRGPGAGGEFRGGNPSDQSPRGKGPGTGSTVGTGVERNNAYRGDPRRTAGTGSSAGRSSRGGAAGGDSRRSPTGYASQQGSSSQQGSAGGNSGGSPGPQDHSAMAKQRSLADSRGRNWALPGVANSSIPVHRQIYIECHGDRLLILPDRKQIALGNNTSHAVEELVSVVWDRIGRWGIAGQGMYWRPSLVFRVSPDGRGRYSELEQLLDGSGLAIEAQELKGPVARRSSR